MVPKLWCQTEKRSLRGDSGAIFTPMGDSVYCSKSWARIATLACDICTKNPDRDPGFKINVRFQLLRTYGFQKDASQTSLKLSQALLGTGGSVPRIWSP